MQTKTRKVPRLRFREFSGEWQEKKLGDLIARLDAGVSVNSEDRSAKSHEKAILKTSCVTRGVFDAGENKVVTNKVEIDRLKESLKKDTIVISRMNTPLLVGANALVYESNDDIFLPDRLWAAKVEDSASPNWIALKLGGRKMRARLSVLATGTSNSMKNITKGDVLNAKIYAPVLEEQKKIAGFLGVVDDKISALQSKKELLDKYKKGIMQKIFSQEKRFKDGNNKDYPAWHEKSLNEVGKTYNGLKGKTADDFGSGQTYITYKQIFDNSTIDTSKFGLVSVSSQENQNTVIWGDILFTTSSETPDEVGFASVMMEEVQNVYLNSFCFGFRPNNLKNLVPEFAQFLFRGEKFRGIMHKLAQGSTRYNISKN